MHASRCHARDAATRASGALDERAAPGEREAARCLQCGQCNPSGGGSGGRQSVGSGLRRLLPRIAPRVPGHCGLEVVVEPVGGLAGAAAGAAASAAAAAEPVQSSPGPRLLAGCWLAGAGPVVNGGEAQGRLRTRDAHEQPGLGVAPQPLATFAPGEANPPLSPAIRQSRQEGTGARRALP